MRCICCIVAASLLQTACVGVTPRVQIVEKAVAVPVACVPDDVPWDEPVFPDTDAALAAVKEPGDAILLLGQGRLLRQKWFELAWDALQKCRQVGAPLSDSANGRNP